MDGTLNLLYTCNLRGDLSLLPRLYSLIARLRREPTLLLDLGGACCDDAWHCRETGGRSMFIALDAMGYHAANVAGSLDSATRDSFQSQVTVALVDESRDWRYRVDEFEIRVGLSPNPGGDPLEIDLSPAPQLELGGTVLSLRGLEPGQLGQVILDLRQPPQIISQSMHAVTPDLPQNPSIAATVAFIESEARLFQRKRL